MLWWTQTLTTKDCKGPQTNMPENVGSIKTWSAKMKSRHIKFCKQNTAMLIVLREPAPGQVGRLVKERKKLVKKGRNYLYHSISYHIHPYALEFAAFHNGIIRTWKIKLVKYVNMKNKKTDGAGLLKWSWTFIQCYSEFHNLLRTIIRQLHAKSKG